MTAFAAASAELRLPMEGSVRLWSARCANVPRRRARPFNERRPLPIALHPPDRDPSLWLTSAQREAVGK